MNNLELEVWAIRAAHDLRIYARSAEESGSDPDPHTIHLLAEFDRIVQGPDTIAGRFGEIRAALLESIDQMCEEDQITPNSGDVWIAGISHWFDDDGDSGYGAEVYLSGRTADEICGARTLGEVKTFLNDLVHENLQLDIVVEVYYNGEDPL